MRGSDIKDPADLRCDASVTERDDGNVSPYVAHFRYCVRAAFSSCVSREVGRDMMRIVRQKLGFWGSTVGLPEVVPSALSKPEYSWSARQVRSIAGRFIM